MTEVVARIQVDMRRRYEEGDPAIVEDYHERLAGHAVDDEVWLELIATELRARSRHADRPGLAEYAGRFPHLAGPIQQLLKTDLLDHRVTPPIYGRPARAEHLPGWVDSDLGPVAGPESLFPRIPGYEILGVLGRGGMGIVYKARQKGLNRLVAIKMILAGNHVWDEDRARFRHEAEAVAALRHPNIVQVYEIGEHDGRPYFSLEFVDGGTLGQKLRGQPQPAAFAAEMCETLARAIHAVHSINIIHRDLKPANVLLQGPTEGPAPEAGPAPRVAKISDFGLAKRLGAGVDLTATGAVAGTPAYMAPEQVRGERGTVGPAADVWALGIILYEMLTGRPPFLADSAIETMHRVASDAPVQPRQLQPKIPRDLETICLKCLEKSPGRRYETAQTLADDLRRFRDGRPVQARRVGAVGQAWRWCGRNPVVAGLLATVLLVSATGASAAGFYAVQAHTNADEARVQATKAEENAREATAKEVLAVRATTQATAARAEEERQKVIATDLAAQALDREARGIRERYALESNIAFQAWGAGDLPRTRQFLDRYAPKNASGKDLRGFEWFYLTRLCRSDLIPQPLTDTRACGLAVFPDGKRFAFATGNEVRVYDPSRGARPVVFLGHTDLVTAVVCDPAGGRLASTSWDGTVRVWEVATGALLHTLRGHADGSIGVAFSPDGNTLVSCGGRHMGGMKPGEVIIWDLPAGKPRCVLRDHISAVNGIAFSADGKLLASGGFDRSVHLYDPATGAHVREIRLRHTVLAVGFHPRKRLLVASSSSGPIAVCDPASGVVLRELHGHADWVCSLAFSADGTYLVSGGFDGLVRIWNPETGELLRALRGHVGTIDSVRFNPKTHLLVSLGEDGLARHWDVARASENTVLANDPPFEPAAALLSPDGTRLLTIKMWGHCVLRDVATSRPLPFPENLTEKKLVRGAVLLSGGETVALWLGDGSTRFHGFSGRAIEPPVQGLSSVTGMAGSRDGRVLGVLSADGSVSVHDLITRTAPRVVRVAGVTSIALGSGDDPLLAVATKAGNVHLFSPRTGDATEFATRTRDLIGCMCFSPDGRTLAGGEGPRVRLWDVHGRKELWCDETHTGVVTSLSFSAAGDRIATASWDRAVKILDSATGRETITLRGHTRRVLSSHFTPDGTGVISVGLDFKILLWGGSQPAQRSSEVFPGP